MPIINIFIGAFPYAPNSALAPQDIMAIKIIKIPMIEKMAWNRLRVSPKNNIKTVFPFANLHFFG
jgi:hypothetical protein